jgi:DNA-directed RNA polymerase subunit RPC12/RpoP
MIKFQCTHCSQPIEAPDEMIGMEIECPGCGKTVRVAAVQTGAPSPPPSAKPPENQIPKITSVPKQPSRIGRHSLVFLAGFLVVVSGVYVGNRMSRRAPTTWEYRIENVSFPTFNQDERPQQQRVYEAFLNWSGNDGWEVVGLVPTHDGYRALYKRPCEHVTDSFAKFRVDQRINELSK